jgi:ankyrin repeat protein
MASLGSANDANVLPPSQPHLANVPTPPTPPNANALHEAAQEGNLGAVQALISRGANVYRVDGGSTGATPLHRAAQYGHMNVVQALVAADALVDQCDFRGWSPLHLALQGPHVQIAAFLIARGADVNRVAKNGVSPLYIAVGGRCIESVKLVVSSGGSVTWTPQMMWSPLFYSAMIGGCPEILQCLIDGIGGGGDDFAAAVNRESGYNRGTPLHNAAKWGHLENVVILLGTGVADIDKTDRWGKTAFDLAKSQGNNDIVACLNAHRRSAVRHECLVCIANARRAQDTQQDESLHPLLGAIARLPPEVVREHVIPCI